MSLKLDINITKTIVVGLLLASPCLGGLACGEQGLTAVSRNDAGQGIGGMMATGVGGAAPGTGGTTGLGGQSGLGIGGMTAVGTGGSPVDPFAGWQVFLPANNKLDLLFMIDNSQSMAPLQDKLLANIPVMMNILKGLPMGLPDIHVAVISSDTGPGLYDESSIHCRYLGDQGLFQNQPRGDCITSPLAAGQTFLQASNNQAQTNYTGDITDALTCIAALGDQGCGFEGQLKSVRWALDTNPNDDDPAPAGVADANSGFLRPDAYLAVILFTNEDDCSVPTWSDLIDNSSIHNADRYGPLWSFRCNEYGHLCNINGTMQHPVRGVNTNLTDCISNDTPPVDPANPNGVETRISDEIAFLKGLKSDPSQIFVAAITGPVRPYNVQLISQTLSDGSMELQPNTEHSCMENSGEYADPAIRIQQWAEAFGSNGFLLQMCADSFAPAFTTIGTALSQPLGPQCVTGPFPIDPTTKQLECRVVDYYSDSNGDRVETPMPNCAGSNLTPCWTLSDNTIDCPGGQELVMNRGTSTVSTGTRTAFTCQPCPAGQSDIGLGCP